ncbi:MAG: peroxiredoxin [Pseudomonadota bacterium]|jgi:peroxiredoxin|uniref:Glutathione-dependent peroxiredoxin n=1 Tax=Qipengyuania pacifica TaxID=2860199 RepID=A0ABS7JGY0_9SPHN|nr:MULTISPECIES: peroxiredoxin [Erythrobacteraceae]MAB44499.1 peroxiredoxin [Sphingomonadaceae bacterium]MAG42301.1 peroxiredoxin [Erythrobacteraceae bacterium]MBL4897385.1 peroxiredoxin [Erythrobacter sp.]MEC7889685.1 peroxiredoxin [Pseudomonadota bacterium]QPL38959.1 peroxiredoxin [Erythrobacter sp. A30-3]|tara:strand:- start:107 stop:586 length:480 start_codon:yes stop_codon:yes gene_type:complete
MTISVGDKLPDVTLVKATENGPEQVNAAEYFKGKKVALFSVPGAFTPTCSARHLPGYVEKADELKSKGVDEIVATAVNDAFVMGAWNNASGSNDITMLADGNGDFAEAVGLTMDGSGFGLGKRGQRYSMVVDDGVVTQLNVEQPGDFSVSSAEHMLGQL